MDIKDLHYSTTSSVMVEYRLSDLDGRGLKLERPRLMMRIDDSPWVDTNTVLGAVYSYALRSFKAE